MFQNLGEMLMLFGRTLRALPAKAAAAMSGAPAPDIRIAEGAKPVMNDPDVVAAAPGIRTYLDLPLIAGAACSARGLERESVVSLGGAHRLVARAHCRESRAHERPARAVRGDHPAVHGTEDPRVLRSAMSRDGQTRIALSTDVTSSSPTAVRIRVPTTTRGRAQRRNARSTVPALMAASSAGRIIKRTSPPRDRETVTEGFLGRTCSRNALP